MSRQRTQIASDIIRDGIGVELLDAKGDVVAEVFRCDRDHTVTVSCSRQLTERELQWLLPYASETFECFEDETPLPEISAWPIVVD
ncbi:MAG: hypothetical protein AAGG48_23315 [Planctomycetota bacterium]